MKIKKIDIKKDMKVKELIEEFSKSGVLGSGRVSKATELLTDMIRDDQTKVFLSLAGPLVPGGMRNIVSQMIKDKQIDVLITSGANITHDLLEAFGGSHYSGMGFDDEDLNQEGIGRIGDVYTKNHDFEVFEKEITKIFQEIHNSSSKDPRIISIKDLLNEIGSRITDENSILKAAHDNGVHIYAPGIIDSMLGLQLWMFTQENNFVLDAIG
ncbi:MAG: deoxyhypusine synthase family protein, partial [Methanobrevibacter sp.]|nr:deoxyhypusine synthase family protein [Methanobrevibacter sp.]